MIHCTTFKKNLNCQAEKINLPENSEILAPNTKIPVLEAKIPVHAANKYFFSTLFRTQLISPFSPVRADPRRYHGWHNICYVCGQQGLSSQHSGHFSIAPLQSPKKCAKYHNNGN